MERTDEGIERRIIRGARRRLANPAAWLQGFAAAHRTPAPEGNTIFEARWSADLLGANCWCMTAAMELEARAISGDRTSPPWEVAGLGGALGLVLAQVDAAATAGGAQDAATRVASWQDRLGRTHAEVLAALDAAAAEA